MSEFFYRHVMDEPEDTVSCGREAANGRLLPGNTLGSLGGHARSKAWEFRRAIREATSTEQVVKLFERMYYLALSGNVKAADFWAKYVLGLPGKGKPSTNLAVQVNTNGEQRPAVSAIEWWGEYRSSILAAMPRPDGAPQPLDTPQADPSANGIPQQG